jgi:hypothetical protein
MIEPGGAKPQVCVLAQGVDPLRAGHGLVHDLLDLDRGHADGQRGAEHDAVPADRRAGDQGRERHHQSRLRVEVVVGEDLVESGVVEVLDQLGVGLREAGHATGEQPVVVACAA